MYQSGLTIKDALEAVSKNLNRPGFRGGRLV